MINILFLIIPFICGFLFSSTFIFTRIKVANSSGHKLHANSLAIGFFIVSIYTILYVSFSSSEFYHYSSRWYYFWENLKNKIVYSPESQSSVLYHFDNIIVFSLGCILFSYILPVLINRIIVKILNKEDKESETEEIRIQLEEFLKKQNVSFDKEYIKIILTEYENPKSLWYKLRVFIFRKIQSFLVKQYQRSFENEYFETLFYDAIKKDKPVMLTMESGKVYIGNVQRALDFEANRKEINILPWFSGYRESENKDLHLVTNYLDHYEVSTDSNNDSSLYMIVLDFSKIVSASLFDWESFIEKFRKSFEFKNNNLSE